MTIDLETVQTNVTRAAEHGYTDAELSNVRAAFLEARADGFAPQLETWLQAEHPSLVPILGDDWSADTFEGPRQPNELRVQPEGELTADAGAILRENVDLAAFEAEFGPVVDPETFFAGLGSFSPEHERAIEALQAHPEFQELWTWFEEFPGGNSLALSLAPELESGGHEVYGLFVWEPLAAAINVNHDAHIANPLELIDTTLHELLHGAFHIHQRAEAEGLTIPDLPFPDGVFDLYRDPWLNGDGDPNVRAGITRDNFAYMSGNYRGALSRPDQFFDINSGAEDYLRGIVGDIYEQTGVGELPAIFSEGTLPEVLENSQDSLRRRIADAVINPNGGVSVTLENEASGIELPGVRVPAELNDGARNTIREQLGDKLRVFEQGERRYIERFLGADKSGAELWRDIGESLLRRGAAVPSDEAHPRQSRYQSRNRP